MGKNRLKNFKIISQNIFIHVQLKFCRDLEECMLVEENLLKILMLQVEQELRNLQVKPLIYLQ